MTSSVCGNSDQRLVSFPGTVDRNGASSVGVRIQVRTQNLPELPVLSRVRHLLSLQNGFYWCLVRVIPSEYYPYISQPYRSREIKAGVPLEVLPEADIRITNVALADELADESGRTTIKLNYTTPDGGEDSDDEEQDEDEEPGSVKIVTTTLTSLTPGKVRFPGLKNYV